MAFLIGKRAVLIAAAAGACYSLAERFGSPTAAAIWAAGVACGCAVGTALLRTSEIGRITWKNRLAGCLNPWGWRLNRGRLWPIPVISWVAWMAIGAAVFLLRPNAAEEHPSVGPRIGLFAAWVIDAAALMYVLGTIRQATPGARVRPLWMLTAVIALLIAVSVALHLGGLATAALAVGGGPAAVLLAGAALVALVFMTVGRNIRWN